MLCRPIIILSEDVVRNKHGEAISYNDLYGIYLPILSRPQDCVPFPIVLAYDQSHFCPLQTSDGNTGASADSYLPLYQSIEHIQDQRLLPIRFLGDDPSPDTINKSLQNYLHIKKLSYFSDANSSSIYVTCAELGSKHLPNNDSFYLLYYNYITDFYETQKRKLKEDDDEKRRRDDEYYYSNQSSHETTQPSLIKLDSSPSSSPPPPYSSKILRSNENKNNLINDRRSSYDKAVANGNLHTSSNDNNRSTNEYYESPKPPSYVQVTQRAPLVHDSYRSTVKQYQLSPSNWESVDDDLMQNSKPISTNQRGNDSKIKQGKSPLIFNYSK
jgi:hypothetical protein